MFYIITIMHALTQTACSGFGVHRMRCGHTRHVTCRVRVRTVRDTCKISWRVSGNLYVCRCILNVYSIKSNLGGTIYIRIRTCLYGVNRRAFRLTLYSVVYWDARIYNVPRGQPYLSIRDVCYVIQTTNTSISCNVVRSTTAREPLPHRYIKTWVLLSPYYPGYCVKDLPLTQEQRTSFFLGIVLHLHKDDGPSGNGTFQSTAALCFMKYIKVNTNYKAYTTAT
jgi:hypothetical protein